MGMNLLRCLVLSMVALGGVNCGLLGDIAKSTVDVTAGVVHSVGNVLPTPKGLFETSKQLIAGYPLEFVSDSISTICSMALASDAIKVKYMPDINQMQFQLRNGCKNHSFPLLDANKMWTSPFFNASKKVVILATGWTTTVESVTIDALAKAYNCRGDTNFVALDAASYVDTLYTWSAFNTDDLGMHVATGLQQLMEIVPVENIQLIGHSLGAHIMGSAGRHFQLLTGKSIPHITGLDPAKPCFNEGETLSGLQKGDADFVDIIHTNPGILGKRDPIGDADFYPGGLDPLPSGCLTIFCAHARAWEFYAETVYPGNEFNFMGIRCTSLTRLRAGKCRSAEVPMGYAIPFNVKGNYFLEINSKSPFGVNNKKQSNKNDQECGKCL